MGSINYGFGSQQALDFSVQQVYSLAQQRNTLKALNKNIEKLQSIRSPKSSHGQK